MTEDITHYRFDFEREVSALRATFDAQKRLAVMFFEADVGDRQLERKIKNKHFWKRKITVVETITTVDLNAAEDQPLSDLFFVGVLKNASETFSSAPWHSSYKGRMALGADFIVFRKDDYDHSALGESNADIMKLRTLYHEAGHALIPNTRKIYGECAADAYAALQLLRRFGKEVIPFLSQQSWLRSMNGLSGDIDHLTTTVLDRILMDARHQDFSHLSYQRIVDLAIAYADAETPSVGALNILRQAAGTQPGIKSTAANLMSFTSLSSSPMMNFGLYISAKNLFPFLSGMLCPDIQYKFADVKEDIEARLETMRAADIFNEKAAGLPPLTETPAEAVKILLQEGEKRLGYHSSFRI